MINAVLGITSVSILSAHFVGTFLNWYQPDNSYDNFIHILAGFWLGIIMIKVVEKYRLFSSENSFLMNCLLVACLTLAIGAFWEFFEFSIDYFDRYFYGVSVLPANVADTLGDLFFDFAGALIAAFFFVEKNKKQT